MHRAMTSVTLQGWSPLTGQALVPAFLIRSLGFYPTLLSNSLWSWVSKSQKKIILMQMYQVHFTLACFHVATSLAVKCHIPSTPMKPFRRHTLRAGGSPGGCLDGSFCVSTACQLMVPGATGRILLTPPVLRASLWLSVTQYPPRALFNSPANWPLCPHFLKMKYGLSLKEKYWITFSENIMIFKLYGLSWMCSLSFGLCVCFLDMKLKAQVVFYLTSLGPNPSLNRHGYLHLCIFVTKKWIFFSYCKVKEMIKTRISGNHLYNAWIFLRL